MSSCASAVPVFAEPTCMLWKGIWREQGRCQCCPTSWATRMPAGSRKSARRCRKLQEVGDAVICHPLVTSGHCLACRRGDDMHATDSKFPGHQCINGGYAQYAADRRALADQAAEVARAEGCRALHGRRPHRLPCREEGLAPSAAGPVLSSSSAPVASAISASRCWRRCARRRSSSSTAPTPALALGEGPAVPTIIRSSADGGEVDGVMALTHGRTWGRSRDRFRR